MSGEHVPLPGYEDVRVPCPRCTEKMCLAQLCGGRHGGPTVGHWWCNGCQKLYLERAGNYRCVHERPGGGLNEPPLTPREPDPMDHVVWRKRWVLHSAKKGVLMGGMSGWGNCYWSDTMSFHEMWAKSGASTFATPEEALQCKSYHEEIGGDAKPYELECGLFAQPEDLIKIGLTFRDWRKNPNEQEK